MGLFLNEVQQNKLAILTYLISNDYQASTKDLATMLNLSTKSIIRICKSLNEEIEELGHTNVFSLLIRNTNITLTFTERARPSFLIESFTAFYTENSIKYRIISTLLSKKHSNVASLADSLYLSTPNTYTHLYQLEDFLLCFGITLIWDKKEEGLNFIYDEKKMLYFAHLFYWRLFKGTRPIDIPDFHDEPSQIESTFANPLEDSFISKNNNSLIWYNSQNYL